MTDKDVSIEDLTVSEKLRGAYTGADPAMKGNVGRGMAELSLKTLDSLSAHFRAAVAKSGDTAVFAVLPQVDKIEGQVALDRQQFPAIDGKTRKSTEKILKQSKAIAQSFIKAAMRETGTSDVDRLIFVEHARMQMSAAVVYHDRLKNAADKKNSRPSSRKRASP